MQPIDRPFRPCWDFFVAWSLLALATFWMIRRMASDQPWYAFCALIVVLSLFATIILYGPVLLARQIVRSGSRGRFVARVLVSMLLAAVLFAAVLLFTGHGDHPPWWTGAATCVAIIYLHWRLRDEPHA
jgi:hypothetical protein